MATGIYAPVLRPCAAMECVCKVCIALGSRSIPYWSWVQESQPLQYDCNEAEDSWVIEQDFVYAQQNLQWYQYAHRLLWGCTFDSNGLYQLFTLFFGSWVTTELYKTYKTVFVCFATGFFLYLMVTKGAPLGLCPCVKLHWVLGVN